MQTVIFFCPFVTLISKQILYHTVYPHLFLHNHLCRFCEEVTMATNLAIDEMLLQQALTISGLKTKKATVNAALAEFIQRRKMEDIVSMFGKVEMDKKCDYKKMRCRK